jgi:hypothetical protein
VLGIKIKDTVDPLMPWDENLRLYLWFTWKWERYVSYCGTGKNLIKVTFFWPTLYNRKAKNTTLSEQFQTTIENYRKRQINVRENRRTIKNGQARDTVNIDHTKTNKTQHIYRKLKRYRPHHTSNTAGVLKEAGTAYLLWAPWFTPCFWWGLYLFSFLYICWVLFVFVWSILTVSLGCPFFIVLRFSLTFICLFL